MLSDCCSKLGRRVRGTKVGDVALQFFAAQNFGHGAVGLPPPHLQLEKPVAGRVEALQKVGIADARREDMRNPPMVNHDCRRLLEACDNDSDVWLGPIVRLAIETGMRQGELCGLKWKDIDLVKGLALLRETKNGEMRVVPLSQAAREVLA